MNASVLLNQPKMMLAYPQPAVFRPTFVSHGMVQQPIAQFPNGFPVAIAPTTILHTQMPPHSSFPAVIPSAAVAQSSAVHKPPVIVPTSPPSIISNTNNTPNSKIHSPKSPPSKQTHSSFSIDSILGKKDPKTSSSNSDQGKVPVSPIPTGSPRATAGTNGLMYFYTPGASQPPCSPFPFATAPRPFDHDLQRSPLGSMVISSGRTM